MEHKNYKSYVIMRKHGHCALRDKPLFDVIEAWGHGPVVPTLYQKYKSYGGRKFRKVMAQ